VGGDMGGNMGSDIGVIGLGSGGPWACIVAITVGNGCWRTLHRELSTKYVWVHWDSNVLGVWPAIQITMCSLTLDYNDTLQLTIFFLVPEVSFQTGLAVV